MKKVMYAAFLLASDPQLLRKPRLLWKPAMAFLLCFLVVFAFVNSLYRKRERQKHLLSHLTETSYP